jgi:Peptidase family C25
VSGLANVVPRVPVVWSFSCSNSDLTANDSIAEYWMENPSSRAVSHYGATIPSNTDQNHELDRRMFKAVYDLGLVTQSHAIQYAEDQMSKIVGSDNAWMYLLLGDPEMHIRRRNPLDLKIRIPEYVSLCQGPGCYLSVSVLDEIGNPVEGARFALWKSDKAGDELQVNRYTDESGSARIPVSLQSTGTLYYSVQDNLGNVKTGTVAVR